MQDTSKQLRSLLQDNTHEVTILSNMSAFIMQTMENVSWVGFYLAKKDYLYLGPFQGKVACTKIPIGKGVCGHVASTLQSIIVKNVHEFEGHIACDSESNSEIVLPVMQNDTLYGVLDLDSTQLSRFTQKELQLLEEYVHILEEKLQTI